MFAVSLHIYLQEGIEERYEEINRYSRSVLYNFELINIIDPVKDTSKQIYSNLDFDPAYGFYPLREGIRAFAKKTVYSEDEVRYLVFMDMDTLDERIAKADGAFVQQPFRFYVSENSVEWKLARIIRLPTSDSFCYMFSLQRITPMEISIIGKLSGEKQ